MRTAVIQDEVFLAHDTGVGHPERPARLQAVSERLQGGELKGALEVLPAVREASLEDIGAVHDLAYFEHAAERMRRGPAVLDQGDTVTGGPGSLKAALLAAGAGLDLADRLMAGEIDNGFALVRPPGHHAERAHAMGFCVVNNIAILARYLQRRHGLEKVAIVDFDVHHGNGTQNAFWDDPSVLFVSLHQYPHWPGSGAASERGGPEAEGATMNIPMASGSGPPEYERAFEQQVLPAVQSFAPEALLISAGFDAHRRDPLSSVQLESDSYHRMTAQLLDAARESAKGRVLSLLEGGYDLEALAESAEAHLKAYQDGA